MMMVAQEAEDQKLEILALDAKKRRLLKEQQKAQRNYLIAQRTRQVQAESSIKSDAEVSNDDSQNGRKEDELDNNEDWGEDQIVAEINKQFFKAAVKLMESRVIWPHYKYTEYFERQNEAMVRFGRTLEEKKRSARQILNLR